MGASHLRVQYHRDSSAGIWLRIHLCSLESAQDPLTHVIALLLLLLFEYATAIFLALYITFSRLNLLWAGFSTEKGRRRAAVGWRVGETQGSCSISTGATLIYPIVVVHPQTP